MPARRERGPCPAHSVCPHLRGLIDTGGQCEDLRGPAAADGVPATVLWAQEESTVRPFRFTKRPACHDLL